MGHFIDSSGLTFYTSLLKEWMLDSMGNLKSISMQVVAALPAVAEAKDNVIYLVKTTSGDYEQANDIYDEFILVDDGTGNKKFERIGSTDVDLSVVTQTKDGLMIAADKKKLDGIEEEANNYTHPAHTAYESGLYKVTIDDEGHITSAIAVVKSDITNLGIPGDAYVLPKASATALGGVKVGENLTIEEDGTLNATDTTYDTATSTTPGLVKSTATGTTANRDYNVEVKDDGTMKVNVPWTDTDTTYQPMTETEIEAAFNAGIA